MRVIAGKHRGAVLNEFAASNIRPTADRTKESVFNIISDFVHDSVCLDLFCGTGNLGIEALSRGAKEVVFVDNSKESVALTKKNLEKVRENAKVFLSDAISFLKTQTKKYDIIFIDPPYGSDVSIIAVKTIFENDLLTQNGIIVFERDVPFVSDMPGISVFDQRKYGKAVISFVRKTRKCLFAGTFDPFTSGHEDVVKTATKRYDEIHVCVMNNPSKKPLFLLQDRLEIIQKSLIKYEKIIVSSWDGLLVDYMKKHGILVNVRGIRDDKDLGYEKEMERVNMEYYPDIIYDYIYTGNPVSSSFVRETIENGGDISFYVNKNALNLINKAYQSKTK
mgnify:CR=1 FL=1